MTFSDTAGTDAGRILKFKISCEVKKMATKPQPYISRLVVKAVRPVPQGPEYTIEIAFPTVPTKEEFEAARKALLGAIYGWQAEILLEEFDKLPWKHYQTKALVGPGHTGWILVERDGGQTLAKLIEACPEKKLRVGQYEFSFSGEKNQFLSRQVTAPAAPETPTPPTPEPPAATPSNGASQP